MLSDLKRAARRSDEYDDSDFRCAAAELMRRQFLWFSEPQQRRHYRIVVRHLNYFNALVDALGWRLCHDEQFGFVGIVPESDTAGQRLRLDETAVLIIARLIYEEGVEACRAEHGCVWVDGVELVSRYETLLRRPPPRKTRIVEILSLFKRHGLFRLQDIDGEMPRVALLPTLRLVTNERSVSQLEAFIRSAPEAGTETGGEGETS